MRCWKTSRVTGRIRTFAPGEEVAITLGFEYEGREEIESVEAVFVREGSGEEISLVGDAKKEASRESRKKRYTTWLGTRIALDAAPGEYRCARLSGRDSLDDDRDFADAARLDLVIRVARTPHWPEVTTSEFL